MSSTVEYVTVSIPDKKFYELTFRCPVCSGEVRYNQPLCKDPVISGSCTCNKTIRLEGGKLLFMLIRGDIYQESFRTFAVNRERAVQAMGYFSGTGG